MRTPLKTARYRGNAIVGRLAASYCWRHIWQHAIESLAATNGGFIPGGRQSSVFSRSHSGTPDIRPAVRCGPERQSSSRHVLPRDLSNALKQLDDGELDRLFAATRHELQQRGRLPTSTPVIRSTTHMGTEQRASDQSTTTEESPKRRQPEEPNVALTPGQVNAVRATFKAGITPTRIARQFGISQSDVRKVLASESRRSGKRR
jgi:predicted DNA-binding protein (UPF0251 family)